MPQIIDKRTRARLFRDRLTQAMADAGTGTSPPADASASPADARS